MINLEETLDILKEMEAIEWKSVTYDTEEKDIKNPTKELSFIKKMIFPLCLIAVYVCCRSFLGGRFLESIFVVAVVAVIWKVVFKIIHMRKREVKERLEELSDRRNDLVRQYTKLDNMLADSIVPGEYLDIESVERLILYMDSGEARTLREAISSLKLDHMREKMASQEEEIDNLRKEVKSMQASVARANKEAAKARSAASSASTISALSRLSKK